MRRTILLVGLGILAAGPWLARAEDSAPAEPAATSAPVAAEVSSTAPEPQKPVLMAFA